MKKRSFRQSEMIRVWTLVIVRVILLLAAVILSLWFLYEIRALLFLLILAVFVCYLIAPLVRFVEQPVYLGKRELKVPRGAAIGMVYLMIGGLLFLGLRLLWPLLWDQITELAKNLPRYISSATTSVNNSMNDANSWMRHLKLPKEWRDSVLSSSGKVADSLLPWLQDVVGAILGYLTYLPWMILVPVLAFFMLKDAALFEQEIVSFMPTERLRKRVHWLLLDVSRTLAAYIRAQLTACLVIWMLVTAGLGVIGVPYALVLGAVAGVLEFVPLVGPLISAIVICGLGLTESWQTAVIAALFLLVLRIVQDYVIYPKIVGHGIKIHPLVVVIAILCGAEIGGLIGIFLAVPVVGLMMVGYNHYLAYKGIQRLEVPPDNVAEPVGEAEASSSGSEAPILQK
ncbi:MAG TPA: AI-2E family transporter [Blastocatellia bacterium]|nr:AI-2E family transporter [Blastocatellia bacterium]